MPRERTSGKSEGTEDQPSVIQRQSEPDQNHWRKTKNVDDRRRTVAMEPTGMFFYIMSKLVLNLFLVLVFILFLVFLSWAD